MGKPLQTMALLLIIPITVFLLLDRLYPVDLSPRSSSRVVLAADGSVLRAFPDRNGVWRYPTSTSQVSENYLQALIGYEDRFFYAHPGINPLALLRAAAQWLSSGRIISGGSTLTMQVARLRYPAPRTLANKLIELVRSLQLEWHYSKQEILDYYLNHAPFGGTREGVQAAAFHYFGYSAEYLTDAQAALLAVLPQAPSHFRPDRYPERARQARDKLIDRLARQGTWSPARAYAARIEAVDSVLPSRNMQAPLLARRLAGSPGQESIQTFINSRWQTAVAALLGQHVRAISEHASAAALVVETRTGKVRVYAGSADFRDNRRFAHVDMVRAIRSPGSSLKPFVYGMALDNGLIHSQSLLLDIPLSFAEYEPQNFSGGYTGPVSVEQALQQSLNIPAVQVLERLGAKHFYLQLRHAGIPLQMPNRATPNLSMALGGAGISLENLTRAYTALGNAGQAKTLRFTQQQPEQSLPLMSAGAAWIISQILANGDNFPSGQPGYAVKTGTSYRGQDTWAMAAGGEYTVGVWVGQPDGSALAGHYAAHTAVPLLQQILQLLPPSRLPQRPASVSQASICWPHGQRADSGCQNPRNAYVLEDTIPLTLSYTSDELQIRFEKPAPVSLAADSGLRVSPGCPLSATTQTVAVWPAPLVPWLKGELLQLLPAMDPRCQQSRYYASVQGLAIRGIKNGAHYRQYSIPSQSGLTATAAGGSEPYFWTVDGILQPVRSATLQMRRLLPGEHRLRVTSRDGLGADVTFRVTP